MRKRFIRGLGLYQKGFSKDWGYENKGYMKTGVMLKRVIRGLGYENTGYMRTGDKNMG